MSEYYIPDISELYVGFEYQSMCIENAHWGICKVEEDFATPPYLYEIENETIRVKYLDIDDIESLGFEYYKTHPGTTLMEFEKEVYELSYDPSFKGKQYLRICLEGDVDVTMFSGDIKNKSELKKLLKQLNIL